VRGSTECPNCGMEIKKKSLRTNGNSRTCALCEAIFRMKGHKNTFGKS
jgi:predicted RNA-binding Zn-ribbon protein involved in translation (DUF1610 family)